ncbi:hypothetical protein, partial [Pseudomonas syringae]|uniref:hypothetical protein n=1 Tax=Pseudomonas syringae TaxID=317 RepID=UPI0024E068F9
SHGLKLELEGVFNAVCLGLSHVVSLRLLRHLARDTFFRGKVKVRPQGFNYRTMLRVDAGTDEHK